MSQLDAMSPEERAEAELSALLDGELGDAEASALRARIAADPALAARFAALGEVDSRIRALAADEPASDQLERIRAGLDRRLAGETPSSATSESHGRVIPLRRRVRYAAPVAAALAAALALYLAVGGSPERDPNAGRPETGAPPRIAHEPGNNRERNLAPQVEEPDGPQGAPPQIVQVAPQSDAREPIADRTQASIPESQLADATNARGPASADERPLEDPEALSDEEVAIALQYEMLADLDVIENLDLLERLHQFDAAEPM